MWLEVEVRGDCTTYYLGSPGTSARSRYQKNKPDLSKRFDSSRGWILHGEWISRLKDAAGEGKDTPMHDLLIREAAELDSLDVAKCWSFVYYLIQKDVDTFESFIREIRMKLPRYESSLTPREKRDIQRRAFEEIYDMRVIELEEEWKEKALGIR